MIRAHRAGRMPRAIGMFAVALLAIAAVAPQTILAGTDVGLVDGSWNASGVAAPTAEKPQSKLWFADGVWWGALFSVPRDAFTIHRMTWSTQTWADTGVVIDDRNNAKIDVYWDGARVYVASAGPNPTDSTHSGRVYRFTYSTTTKTYRKDTGFPVTVTKGGMEAIVIARDSVNRLWITYTQSSHVLITHSTTDHLHWAAPFQLPAAGADRITSDDVSAIVAFKGKVGVFWGNQLDMTYRFAVHVDTAPANQWTSEIALQGSGELADDHINLKVDPTGRIFVAAKTSLNASTEPLIIVLVRAAAGGWKSHTFSTAGYDQTRPLVLLDPARRHVYMFAVAPCCSGGVVYYKRTSMDTIAFAAGAGTPFLRSSTNTKINNPASTKQNLTDASGLLVIASDYSTRRYLHNAIDLTTGTFAVRKTG